MSCDPTNHDQHMCMLVAKRTPVEDLKVLAKDAKYICKNCGRAAAEAKNICAPEAF